jgi:hypothetical protein
MRANSAAGGDAPRCDIGRAHVAPIFHQFNMLRRFVGCAERTRRAPRPVGWPSRPPSVHDARVPLIRTAELFVVHASRVPNVGWKPALQSPSPFRRIIRDLHFLGLILRGLCAFAVDRSPLNSLPPSSPRTQREERFETSYAKMATRRNQSHD